MYSVNNPVHFVTKDGKMSPSAFIPFCEFGGNMSTMGISVKPFAVPVCNSFQEKILNDQLCYEVDLDRYSNKDNIDRELGEGLVILLDFNEDRQVTFEQNQRVELDEDDLKIMESDVNYQADVYLEAIGKYNNCKDYWRNNDI